MIAACEERYDLEVKAGAQKIIDRLPDVRMAFIAGPSSSSKTTTTIKVSEKLAEAGMEFLAINLDHYFFDLEQHPKDEFGDYDYETPQALDLKLINQHLADLLAGKTIKTPHYDFKTGTRQLDVHEMKLAKNQMLLIDSLHGLYGEMTQSTPNDKKFKLYIETLGQVRNKRRALHALGRQPAAAPHDPRQLAPQPPARADADPLALRATQRAAQHHPVHRHRWTIWSTARCPSSCRS